MKVYHGTDIIIKQPKIINRFKTLDFGEGFYTTTNEIQAREFAVKICKRRKSPLFPVVNCYEFSKNLVELAVLIFDAPNEKWLDFVIERRKGIPMTEKYDLIIGPVANDDVFGTIILYEAGQLDKESAINRFKIKQLHDQVLFCNESVLRQLTFVKSYIVEVEDER